MRAAGGRPGPEQKKAGADHNPDLEYSDRVQAVDDFLAIRLENWKLLRAFLWPYFLRSTIRASRVSKPLSRSFRLEVRPKFLEGTGQAQHDRA